jgi:ABC-type multidrug transport system ATPase subunit
MTIERPGTPGGGRVEAVEVSRPVGARKILQELSLSIEPGELVAVAGGSGAGKTTRLEILAGLQPPSSGEVRPGRRTNRDAPRLVVEHHDGRQDGDFSCVALAAG